MITLNSITYEKILDHWPLEKSEERTGTFEINILISFLKN